jgi:hypothetical protein
MKGLDYDLLFPGRFIKAAEFKGKDVLVTISSIDLEDLPQDKGGERVKGIISFAGKKKKLVLNRTNGECFKAMFGRDTGEWVGKRVVLYPAVWNGDPCIRVRGSPDIAEDKTFELKLPKKRPQKVTMFNTATKNGGAARTYQQPVQEEEPVEPPDSAPETDGADIPF